MSQTIDNIIYSDDLKTVSGVENKKITTAVIKEGVTTIGEYAFKSCKIENYEHKLFKIKNGCFLSSDEKTVLYCTNDSKQEIVIPEGVTSIGKDAFSYCENLQSVTIPSSVTEISDTAFQKCKIENYEHKLFKIKNGCFLSSDEKTVLYCTNVSKQEIVIPEGVTTIGERAFWGCKNLQSVVIPEGVTEIGEDTFHDCENLQSVTIPEGVTEIGFEAFEGCKNLQNVTIPEGVTSIGDDAFYGCENLTVTFDGTKEEWEKIEGVEECGAENVKFNK